MSLKNVVINLRSRKAAKQNENTPANTPVIIQEPLTRRQEEPLRKYIYKYTKNKEYPFHLFIVIEIYQTYL